MLKNAYDQGYFAALEKFALTDTKTGGGGGGKNSRPSSLAVHPSQAAPPKPTSFGAKQKASLSQLGRGVGGWAGGGSAATKAMGKSQALAGLKGVAPSLALGAAGLWGAKKLLGGSKKQQPTQQFG